MFIDGDGEQEERGDQSADDAADVMDGIEFAA